MVEKGKTGLQDDSLDGLIKAAHNEPSVPDDFESKVMLQVARRSIAHSRQKAKQGLIASMSGLAMLLAGCIALIVKWFPMLPLFENLRKPITENGLSKLVDGSLPFLDQWGGFIAITLFLAGAAGFGFYLNSLFSNTHISES